MGNGPFLCKNNPYTELTLNYDHIKGAFLYKNCRIFNVTMSPCVPIR